MKAEPGPVGQPVQDGSLPSLLSVDTPGDAHPSEAAKPDIPDELSALLLHFLKKHLPVYSFGKISALC